MTPRDRDALDYLAGRLPAARRAELDATLGDPESPLSRALRDLEAAARGRRWLPAGAGFDPDAAPDPPAESPTATPPGAEPTRPTSAPGRRRTPGWAAVAVAAALMLSVCVAVPPTLAATAGRVERARLHAQAADDARQTSARLRRELLRRLATSLRMSAADAAPASDGQAVTRATVTYQWLALRDQVDPREVRMLHFFNTYPEYGGLSTCQLAAQLAAAAAYPEQAEQAARAAQLRERGRADAVLAALDGVAVKHYGFHDRAGAAAFEADVRDAFPKLIQALSQDE